MIWFKHAETRRIRGVVVSGPALASTAGQDWNLRLTLRPWRLIDDEVRTTALFLDMPARRPMEDRFAKIAAGAVIEVLTKGEIGEWPVPTNMIEVVGVTSDTELERVRATLADRTIDAPPFGTLVFEMQFKWYKGEAIWRGSPVELMIAAGQAEDGEEALAAGRALFAEQDRWDSSVREVILTELLPLKNNTWREAGEAPLDAAAFIGRVTLNSIGVEEDGSFDFHFDDGDLFGGHSIVIAFDAECGKLSADIAG